MYDDIFVNEDISKPENRINLALFHLQMNSDFHNWFFNKLNLDTNSILYPVKNIKGTRPDYVIKTIDDKTIGFIEVECGTDLEQFSRFKNIHETEDVKVYSVFGLKKHFPDISLEEIKEYIESNSDSFVNVQELLSSKYLVELINNTIYTIKDTKRQPVNEDFINSNTFLKELLNKFEYLGIDKDIDINKPIPGHVYYDTNKDKGFSLKVYSSKGVKKGISLLNISGGRPYINFQSEEKYRDYLRHKSEKTIDEWINFISNVLKYPIKTLKYNGKQAVPINIVHQNMDELISNLSRLV